MSGKEKAANQVFEYAMVVAGFGTLFTALASLIVGIAMSWHWSGASGEFFLLLFLWVPLFPIIGSITGFLLFLMVGLLVGASGDLKRAPVTSHAFLGGLFSLIPLLIFCAVALGETPFAALTGNENTYAVLLPGILAAAFSGVFVGFKVRQLA